MTDQVVTELLRLKDEIAKAKTEQAQFQGQLKEKLEQLKTFGVSTIEEAKALLVAKEADLVALEAEVTEKFAALKANYSW